MNDDRLNKLNTALVGTMVDNTPPPEEGMITKFTEALVTMFTPNEYTQLAKECEETGKDISLEIAKRMLALPRSERKRLSKEYGIPWSYLSHK